MLSFMSGNIPSREPSQFHNNATGSIRTEDPDRDLGVLTRIMPDRDPIKEPNITTVSVY